MFYYLYEIRNNLNGKIYIGVHKTKRMDDGYMGSGKVIQSAIEKYGIENFTKVILETFESAEAMYAREKEVVNDKFLLREDVYNLRCGGHGGFDHMIKSGNWGPFLNIGKTLSSDHIQKMVDTKSDRRKKGAYVTQDEENSVRMTQNNPMKREDCKIKVSEALKSYVKTDEHKTNISTSMIGVNKGKKHLNRKKRDPVVTRIVVCPHCGKSGGIHGMTRWHFDNCKEQRQVDVRG